MDASTPAPPKKKLGLGTVFLVILLSVVLLVGLGVAFGGNKNAAPEAPQAYDHHVHNEAGEHVYVVLSTGGLVVCEGELGTGLLDSILDCPYPNFDGASHHYTLVARYPDDTYKRVTHDGAEQKLSFVVGKFSVTYFAG